MTSGGRWVVAIVDDDPAVRDSMRFLLEAHDFDVQTYESGDDFLKEEPDSACLIIDYHMPGLDAFELVFELRKRGSHVPIILITASTDPVVKRRAAQVGIKRVLEKPVSSEVLLGAIRESFDNDSSP